MCLSGDYRISAAGQMDRKDSLGVCVDNKKGEESLQRDQAVCVSSNGTRSLRPDPVGLDRENCLTIPQVWSKS